ncbi:hypothetical protein VNO77_37553 [Canavalia gladiata]|uniref:Uncharacterized protein n=1 Tax=Canavalia gladiata TaxID=3824 RepID=A0AAN9KB77_CANGL
MVVKSLDVVPQNLMVSTKAEKKSESKIAAEHGGNGVKTKKKLRESNVLPMQRRASNRIQAKQKAADELIACQKDEVVEEKDKCNEVEVKTNKRSRKSRDEESVAEGKAVPEPPKKKLVACPKRGVENDERKVESENMVGVSAEKCDSAKEEEKRCGKAEAERKASKKDSKKALKSKQDSKSDKGGTPPEDTKSTAKQPNLKEISKMMENNEILHSQKRIGNISGIEVGHQFYSRAEMAAVGFHSHWLNGIDYMGVCYVKTYSNYEFPVVVAIVLSGMYEDDLDNAEDIVYTGQGGHNLTGDRRQIRDQKLERGNLALENCVEQCVPVRVVRGHGSSSSYFGKEYNYDGLYKANKVYTYDGLYKVYFTNGRVPQSGAEIRGLVCEDITRGQEDMPIRAINLVDDPAVPPTGFTYLKSVKVAKNVKLPMNATRCKCKGICSDPTTCECALRSGSYFPYVSWGDGRLVEAKDIVFECGPKYGCGPDCVNRTSQKGLRYRLEVFRIVKKGWAVRSWDFILSGAPVCEYTGILARTEDMDSVLENNFIFEINFLQTINGHGGRERQSQSEAFSANILDKYNDQGSESVPEYCIDAGSTGNIARFINHCCEPNLFVQCVLSTHNDLKFAHIMLFAADNIPPLQELTYDYGYALDSVLGSDGKIKQMPCYCGAPGCRKRLF